MYIGNVVLFYQVFIKFSIFKIIITETTKIKCEVKFRHDNGWHIMSKMRILRHYFEFGIKILNLIADFGKRKEHFMVKLLQTLVSVLKRDIQIMHKSG